MPSALRKTRNLKFEPTPKPAVFLGHAMQDYGKWFCGHMWAVVEDFADGICKAGRVCLNVTLQSNAD